MESKLEAAQMPIASREGAEALESGETPVVDWRPLIVGLGVRAEEEALCSTEGARYGPHRGSSGLVRGSSGLLAERSRRDRQRRPGRGFGWSGHAERVMGSGIDDWKGSAAQVDASRTWVSSGLLTASSGLVADTRQKLA